MMLTIPPVLGSAAVVVLITWPASLLSLVVVMGIVLSPARPPPAPAAPRLSASRSRGVLKVILFHWRRNTVANIRMVTMATQMVTRTVMVPKLQAVSWPSLQPHSSLLTRKPQFYFSQLVVEWMM